MNTLETGQTGNQPQGSDYEEKNGDWNVAVVGRIDNVVEEEGQHYSNDDAPPASTLERLRKRSYKFTAAIPSICQISWTFNACQQALRFITIT